MQDFGKKRGPSPTVMEDAHGTDTSESHLASCPQFSVTRESNVLPWQLSYAQQEDAWTHETDKGPTCCRGSHWGSLLESTNNHTRKKQILKIPGKCGTVDHVRKLAKVEWVRDPGTQAPYSLLDAWPGTRPGTHAHTPHICHIAQN